MAKIMYMDNEIDALALTAGTGGDDMHTYSTTEQEVGTWIDGSIVYEKSFYQALPTSGGVQDVSFAHGISDIDTIIEQRVSNFVSTGSAVGINGSATYYTFIQSVDATNITYRTNVDGANRYILIVLRYTKST